MMDTKMTKINTAELEIMSFYLTHFSPWSKPGAYIMHSVTRYLTVNLESGVCKAANEAWSL